jgi:hypothetical protein
MHPTMSKLLADEPVSARTTELARERRDRRPSLSDRVRLTHARAASRRASGPRALHATSNPILLPYRGTRVGSLGWMSNPI